MSTWVDTPTTVLRGRRAVAARLDDALTRTAQGRASLVVVEGDPGSGKTTVVRDAGRRASARGFRVVDVTGHEGEADLALAGLSMLLRPLAEFRSALTEGQQKAVRVATGLGDDALIDRFTLGAATMALLSAAAEQQPLLVVVDDAPWLDHASADALAFASRRLAADRVLILVASRPEPAVLTAVPHAERILLPGLPEDDLRAVLEDAGLPVAAPVAATITAATAGLPLAVLETARALTAEQRRGDVPLPDPLPIGEQVTRAYGARLGALPERTCDAVGLAALAGSAPTSTVSAAMTELGLAQEDLAEAEDVAVLRIEDGAIHFAHPLLRAAALDQLPASRRRALHRALADASVDDVERRAHHLASAATGPDEEAALALEAAAAAARRRGGLALAAPVLGRAAALTPPGDLRCDRLLAAAEAFALAGHPAEAHRLSHDVLVSTTDPLRRADAAAVLGRMAVWGTDVADALATARDAAALMTGVDRVRAVRALSQAFMAAMAGATGLDTALRLAEQAVALLDDDMPAAVRDDAHHVHAMGLLAVGRGREAARYFDTWRCPSAAEISADDLAEYRLTGTAQLLCRLGRLGESEELVQALMSACRREAAPAAQALVMGFAAELWWWQGRWAHAVAAADQAANLAEQTGQLALAWFERGVLARVHASRGDAAACRENARWSEDRAREHGLTPVLVYTNSALGLLDLGLGNPAVAAERLSEAERIRSAAGLGDPTMVPLGPDLIEALHRAGRDTEARATLDEHQELAESAGSAWALAALARCRGLMAEDAEDADEHFRTAIALAPADVPFELARTRLCRAERLRRRRDLDAARPLLREAVASFDHLGARPWAQRARAELRLSGERPAYDPPTALSALTAQELRCGLAVADGLSNREVAAALFVSQKTVEYHLNKAYAKLGVRSRTQLARALQAHPQRTDAAE